MSTKVLFGWQFVDGDDNCRGPFNTRKECIEDAKSYTFEDETRKILVGEYKVLDAKEYFTWSAMSFVAHIEERVWDEHGIDAKIFDVPDAKKGDAMVELDALLKAWCDKYVDNTNGTWIVYAGDEVEI